jgi:hypothetical protein
MRASTMRDPADRAQDDIDFQINAKIRNIREQTKKTLIPTGICYYCEDDVGSSVLFCSTECRDDYAREQRMKEINGKR